MDPNEYYTFEDRAYVSPTVSSNEQLKFIDKLRGIVEKDTARVNAQTQTLGTDITSNLGGLTGSEGYFAQRYQTLPVEAQANTLKATAQAKALNDLMTNYQNQAANRYNQAYRSYKKRNNNPTTTSPDISSYLKALGIVTNPGLSNELDVNDGGGRGRPHTIESDANGNLYYVYENFANPAYGYNRMPIYQTTNADNNALIRLGSSASSGTMKTIDGVNYIYLDVGQDRPGWYRYGTAQYVPGVE